MGRKFMLAAVASALVHLVLAPVATAAPGSGLSGTVLGPTGDPIEGICVNVVDDDWNWVGSAPTNPDGTYLIDGLPDGQQLRVQFYDCTGSGWVEQWYSGADSFDSAWSIVLVADEHRGGVDATLELGATVTGVVTDRTGTPLEGICSFAVAQRDGEARSVAWATTDGDGSYRLQGIPAGATRIGFEDCDDVPEFASTWYGGTSYASATVLQLAPGAELTGISVALDRAAVISGMVTDADGPLESVCVQAINDTMVGGSAKTQEDGSYRIVLNAPGSYRVQFVDCDGDPTHAGAWYPGTVKVATGQHVKGVSVMLQPGAAVNVTGTATNIRGQAMTTACAVLYLADEFVSFVPVQPDGSFEFEPVGSGTYAVAYVGCGEDSDDDAELLIADPGASGVSYAAMWAGGAPLELEERTSPDPIAQGAELVALTPGEQRGIEVCFGCGAIDAQLEATTASIRADFELRGVTTGVGVANVDDPTADVEYDLACQPGSSDVADVALAEGPSSPLVVDGLSSDTDFECVVSASYRGVLVADSALAAVDTSATPVAPRGPTPQNLTPAGAPQGAAIPARLSFAG